MSAQLSIKNIQEALTTAVQKSVGRTLSDIHLERPSQSEHGDYSTNIAMTGYKLLTSEERAKFTSPRALAESIAREARALLAPSEIESIRVEGPGFINIKFTLDYILQAVSQLQQDGLKKTLPTLRTLLAQPDRSTVIVEYSSPNIAKPFTIGHLRSTVIGNAVANLYESLGFTVYRDNHLGDWGTQFGKQIYAYLNIPLDPTGEKTNEQVLDNSLEPVKDLVKLYIEFHSLAEQKPEIEDEARQWFKKLEDGDVEARRIWQKCIDWSLREFASIYERLGVKFTENNGVGYGESYFEDKMDVVLDQLKEKKLLKESEGASLVFLDEEQLPPLMILKKDGATLYATRDLATDWFRSQWHERYGTSPLVINEVGGEQAEYFQQLYAVEHKLGWFQLGQRVHVKHGLFRFKEKKMSTRKGNVIWLQEVLDEAVKRAGGSEVIGLGALKWNDLKRSAHLDVVFDWDEILNMEGNSGPYMQYAYTRCASILRKVAEAQDDTMNQAGVGDPGDNHYTPSDIEVKLARELLQYPASVVRAAEEFAPHHLCTYLFSLAQLFHRFYHQSNILQSSGEARRLRIQLTTLTADTLRHGLAILGVGVPEKM